MGMAKASLEAGIRFTAACLGKEGIRCNGISAGPIKTLAASGIADFGKLLGHVAAHNPLRRNVTIEEVGILPPSCCPTCRPALPAKSLMLTALQHQCLEHRGIIRRFQIRAPSVPSIVSGGGLPFEAYFQGNARLAAGGMGNADACFNRLPLYRLAAGAAKNGPNAKMPSETPNGFQTAFFYLKHQHTSTSQPYLSSAKPYWMSVIALRMHSRVLGFSLRFLCRR